MRNMRRVFGPAVLFAGVVGLIGTSVLAQQRPTVTTADPAAGAAETKLAGAGVRGEKRFTRRQLDNVEARIGLATAIVDRLQAEASGSSRVDIWRRSTLESLLALSLPALEQVQRDANSIDGLANAMRAAAEDPNLIGDPNADLVYTPINPCRYIDTRVGGLVLPAAPRGYDLFNSGASYGGSAACALSQNVTAAIALNVTITEPVSAPAFLAVKPTLAAPTTSFMNWYEAGPGVQLANAGVVTVDQTGADPEFFIQVSGATHVIVDFFGFFAEPEATAVDHNILSTETAVAANAGFTIFSPVCPAGWRVTGGGHLANFFSAPAQLAGSRPAAGGSTAVVGGINSATQWLCQGTNSATAQDHRCFVVCARTPGR